MLWRRTVAAGAVLGLALGLAAGAGPAPRVFDPRDFGAVGDGRSHPIGRGFGPGPAEAAAWSRKGGRPFAWMADPRYGLVFTLTPSARQAGPGRVATFLARVPTIFGWQEFAGFNGDPGNSQKQVAPGWLVSGPGIAPNTTVSALDPASGAITFSRDTAAALGPDTPVTFTMPPDVFAALEMDYVGTQAAMDAASAAGGATVAVSAGDYVWNHGVWNPGVADGGTFRGGANLVGADTSSVRIRFTADLGPGGCALGGQNRGPGTVGHAHYANFRLLGPGTPHEDGRAVAGMDGVCLGQADQADHIAVTLFHAGVSLVKDHGVIDRVDAGGNFFGFYFAPNGDSIGNWLIRDSGSNASSWAGLAVAWNNQVDFSLFSNLDLGGGSPYAMYRERTPPGKTQVAAFITNSTLSDVFSEQVGLGWVYGENELDFFDANTCLHCTAWMNRDRYKIPGRDAAAVLLAGRVFGNTFVGTDLSTGGGAYALVDQAIVAARRNVQANDWGTMTGAVLNTVPNKPFLAAPVVAFNRFETDRGGGEFAVAEAAVAAGQVLAFGTRPFNNGVRPMAAGRAPRGVAGQTVRAGQVVAVLTHGLAPVNKTPDRPIMQGDVVVVSSATPTAVTVAGGGATGPVLGVWADGADAGAGATSGSVDLHISLR